MAGAQAASESVVRACLDAGFALVGITAARATSYRDELESWLGAGKHGTMGYLADHAQVRADPSLYLDGIRSFVLVADRYAARGDEAERPTTGRGRIARYARGGDYHKLMKKRLHAIADGLREAFPGSDARCFVDTAPVLEREHGARAGLGWIGKHTLLIHPREGSYLFLGGIATTLDLKPHSETDGRDHCGTCTRCIDACPTEAITPYSVDAGRCISYLTIEHRGVIDERYHAPIGQWLFGCDICQEVCPHNSDRAGTTSVHEAYESDRTDFDLFEVLGWDAEARRAAMTRSAMKRATLAMLKRNAIIVASNQPEPERGRLLGRISEIERDGAEDPLVRETARQVLGSVSGEAPPVGA